LAEIGSFSHECALKKALLWRFLLSNEGIWSVLFTEACGDLMHKQHNPELWQYRIRKGGFLGFFLLMYDIQHCFICRPSDFTVSEDAGIEPRTVATTALAVRRFNH
jgi:hypothetical protein